MSFSLVAVQKRISQGLKVLQYYTTKNWIFKNDKFLRMRYKMTKGDRETFNFSVEDVSSILVCMSNEMWSVWADCLCFIFRSIGTNTLAITFSGHVTSCWKRNRKHYRRHEFYCVACIIWTDWCRSYSTDWLPGLSIHIGAISSIRTSRRWTQFQWGYNDVLLRPSLTTPSFSFHSILNSFLNATRTK